MTDGAHLLLGRFTGLRLWDVPKGLAEAGEAPEAAARRELHEETGLTAPAGALVRLGRHRYRPGKELELFVWPVAAMPDPAALRCASLFRDRSGRLVPEFDAFAVLPWAEALGRVGGNLRRVLEAVRAGPDWPFQDRPESNQGLLDG